MGIVRLNDKDRFVVCPLLGLSGGVVVDVLALLFGRSFREWWSNGDLDSADGVVGPIFFSAIILALFYLPFFRYILPMRDWLIWPMLFLSFLGMVGSQMVFGTFHTEQLIFFGATTVLGLVMFGIFS